MLNRGLRRLVVSLDEIRAHSREMADGVLNQPFDWSAAFNEALKHVVQAVGTRRKEEVAETVRHSMNMWLGIADIRLDVLLCVCRQLR